MNDKTLVERLRNLADEWFEMCDDIHEPLNEAATRIEALEAALRFYARENSWKSCGIYMSGRSQPSAAEVDRGNKARKALESQP
ncbi:hypothetical protein Pam1_27 [Pseudanabaena phage Pam1]|nr:hypothetical protein Pam1_27 [Pseudanabaena phage Pam1]